MAEKGEIQNPISPKDKFAAVKVIATSVGGGWMTGLLGEGVATLISNDPTTAVNWDHGVGGTLGSLMAGFGLSELSLERVEDYLEAGKRARANLELCRAVFEGALGFGGGGAVIGFKTGVESDAPFRAAVGAVAGAALGSLFVLREYKERVRPFPKLIIPQGSTVRKETKYIDRKDGIKFPPIFSAGSLKDVLEFREINKEAIMKWADPSLIPPKSDIPDTPTPRLATSIFIISQVQHFPVADPKDHEYDMNLYDIDGKTNIRVHPIKDDRAGRFYPYDSCFGSTIGEIGDEKYFKKNQWLNERDASWRKPVVVLVQYQDQNPQRNPLKKVDHPTPERVSDNYWLLDIVGEIGKNTGKRKRVEKQIPSGKLVLDPYPSKA